MLVNKILSCSVPGIQWGKSFNKVLSPEETAEIYAALQISPEAADAVCKRIKGEEEGEK